MSYIPVKDEKHLFRDSSSKAIINGDLDGLEAYHKKRAMNEDLRASIQEITTIKNEIVELNQLVKNLINVKEDN